MRPPLGFCCLLLGCATVGFAQPVAPAARLRLEKSSESDWPATVGFVEVWPTLGENLKPSFTTVAGKPVPAATVWSTPGEPSLIRFDTTSGGTVYYLGFDTNASVAAANWQPQAGVLLETRACQEGPLDTRNQFNRLINAAGPVYGRGFVPAVFLGVNPYGPSTDYVALFSGWFNAPRAGDYTFATVSSEASSLQVDGRLITEWLGRHDPHGGRRGEHNGRIALKAGPHHLEYVQAQFTGESAAVAAWKLPGEEHFDVMPASAFLPVARFQIARLDPAAQSPAPLYFEWQNTEHCRLGEVLVVKTHFRAIDDGTGRTYRWRFDDGETQTGASVHHIFALAGVRQVGVEAWAGDTCVGSNTVRLRVEPHWLQREDYRQDVFDDAKREFLRRDLAHTTPRDLEAMFELARLADDVALFNRVAEMLLTRSDDFTSSGSAVIFYQIGLGLQHRGDWGDRLAEQALRLALMPARSVPALTDRVKLRLADLLIHAPGQFEEAQKLLGQTPGNSLGSDERRLWRLLQGDLSLAIGKSDEARQRYQAAGNAPRTATGRFGIGREAVLQSARICLERGDFEQAQRTLDRLAFEAPQERLDPATSLLRLELNLKRQEFQRAFTGAQTLLRVMGPEPQTATVLGVSVEAGWALGRKEAAQRDLRRLLKEFPYSEAAAKAKDRSGL